MIKELMDQCGRYAAKGREYLYKMQVSEENLQRFPSREEVLVGSCITTMASIFAFSRPIARLFTYHVFCLDVPEDLVFLPSECFGATISAMIGLLPGLYMEYQLNSEKEKEKEE